jgi:hypothetical protein
VCFRYGCVEERADNVWVRRMSVEGRSAVLKERLVGVNYWNAMRLLC